MGTSKIIPLSQQPAYREAISKVIDLGRALSEKTAELTRAQSALLEAKSSKPDAKSLLDRALALTKGNYQLDDASAPPSEENVRKLEQERRALEIGLAIANEQADRIAQELARQAGQQARTRHQEATKNVQEALLKLHQANVAEELIRIDLERLGYNGHALPNTSFDSIGSPTDANGTPAYYYMRESERYVSRQ